MMNTYAIGFKFNNRPMQVCHGILCNKSCLLRLTKWWRRLWREGQLLFMNNLLKTEEVGPAEPQYFSHHWINKIKGK